MLYSERDSPENETVMEALLSGDEAKLRDLLNAFQDEIKPYKVCRNGTTLACAAVKTGRIDILKIIVGDSIQRCEESQSKKRLKKTESDLEFAIRDPTTFGCYYRTTSEFESTSNCQYIYLLNTLDNISQLDNFGKNALHYAVLSSDVEMVEYLLSSYRDLRGNQLDINNNSPLHLAVGKDNIEMVKLLLSFGSSVSSKDNEGKTPLHIASERGSTDMISILLNAEADVNALDYRGQSTLMLATIYNHSSAVELLIKRGAKVNYEDDQGFTALKRAVFIKDSKVTKILVENGARICESQNLVHFAVVYNQFEIVESLKHGGARLDTRDSIGKTPLMVAIEYRNLEMVKFLLELGANPNTINHLSKSTSLHMSIFYIKDAGIIETYIDLLLKYGANWYARSHFGFDALYYAFLHKNDPAAIHLIRIGMDVNFRNDEAFHDYLSSCMWHAKTIEPIKWLMYAGFDIKNYEMQNFEVRNESTPKTIKEKFLHSFLRKPLSLRFICRIQIRRIVKHEDLSKLPLQNVLHRFLRLETD